MRSLQEMQEEIARQILRRDFQAAEIVSLRESIQTSPCEEEAPRAAEALMAYEDTYLITLGALTSFYFAIGQNEEEIIGRLNACLHLAV